MGKENKFINLCSHEVTIKDSCNVSRTILPSGEECRVEVLPKDVFYHDGVAISTDVYGDVENLPGAREGVMYIVSSRVINALNGSRKDVVTLGRQVKDRFTRKVNHSIGLRRKF